MALLGSSPSIAFDRRYPFEIRYLTYLSQHALLLSGAAAFDREMDEEQEGAMPTGPAWRSAIARARHTFGAFPPARRLKRRIRRKSNTRGYHHTFVESRAAALRPLAQSNTDLWRAGLKDPVALYRSILSYEWDLAAPVLAEGHSLRSPGQSAVAYAEKIHWTHARPISQAIDTRMLIRVRDPRDVWASILAFDRKRGFYGFGRRAGEDAAAYLRRWLWEQQSYLGWVREQARDARAMVIRYEDLVRDPEALSGEIGALVGLELDAGHSLHASAEFLPRHQTSASPESSIGRHRFDLNSSQRTQIEEELGDLLDEFEYHS